MRISKTDLNFLPPEILKQRQRRRRFLIYSPLVLLGLVVVGGLFYCPQYLAGQCQAKIDQFNREYQQLAQAKSYYEKSQELKADYERKHQAVENIHKHKVDIVEIIDGISSVLPPGVSVTCLEVISSQGVNITFQTDSALRTAQFIVGLRNLPYFEEVEPKQVPLRGSVEEVRLEMRFRGVKTPETDKT